jgi:hypothetical protein
MPQFASPHQIESALNDVRDQSSFVQRLLIGALGWPIDESAAEVNDIAYYWTQAEPRTSGLDAIELNSWFSQSPDMVADPPAKMWCIDSGRGLNPA